MPALSADALARAMFKLAEELEGQARALGAQIVGTDHEAVDAYIEAVAYGEEFYNPEVFKRLLREYMTRIGERADAERG